MEKFLIEIEKYDKAEAAFSNSNQDDEQLAIIKGVLIDVSESWLKLSSDLKEDMVKINDSPASKRIIEQYLEKYTNKTINDHDLEVFESMSILHADMLDYDDFDINDFIHRLKGEPDSMLTLLKRLTDVEIEVTPRLLAEICYRLQEYDLDLLTMNMDKETMAYYIESTDNGIEQYRNLILMRAIRHIMSPEESRKWNS